MAILQISQITNRKGLTENLPQLAGAELGWCVDSRRLFIGNGTLQEGAPIIGNTEILTEFSDIAVLSNYTYSDIAVGYSAQTGSTASNPVVRTVQAKLDDQASVRDFGATGNGVTDDTEAINRALFQLFCREDNTQIRRSLFFPAGTYRVTESIIIPTYAKLKGEGADSTIISLDTSQDLSSLSAYTARLGDSRQQTGVNIGSFGATPPRNIEISSMSFRCDEETDVFLVDRAQQVWFESVNFIGPITQEALENYAITPTAPISCVRFASTSSLTCTDINFDRCGFFNNTYGVNTSQLGKGINVTNSWFETLYQGVVLGNPGPTGFRLVHNIFDVIYAQALDFGDVNLNVSAYNIFYNVGRSIGSTSPITAVIRLSNANNLSVNDLFERSDSDAYLVPRVDVGTSGTAIGASQNQFGALQQSPGRNFVLVDNQVNQTIFSVNNDFVPAFQLSYTISRANAVRTGTIMLVSGAGDSSGDSTFVDDYVENADTGVTLSLAQTGSQAQLQYSSTNLGVSGIFYYSISNFG